MLVQPLEIRIDRTLGSDPARLAVVYPSGDQVSPASLPILAFRLLFRLPVRISTAPLPLIAPARLLSRLAPLS